MGEKKKKMMMSKKDVLFLIGFEAFIEIFIYFWIQGTIENNHISKITSLDQLLFNIILIMPLVIVPLLFIFGVDLEDKDNKESEVYADAC